MDVQGGASGSLRTGPAIDHTTLSKGGDVLYARMALISSKDALIAITPTIDSSNIPNMCLSFWYLAFGNNVGEFYVLIKDISQSMMNLGSTIWSPLFTLRTGISRSKTDWRERPKSSLEIERQRAWKPIGTTQKSKVTNPPLLPFATPPSMKSTAIPRLRGRKTCTKTTLLYDIFSDRKSLCCDGFLFYRSAGNACCAKSAYNTRKQICCGEEIYDKRKFICCNNMAFDKSEFHCCDITALKRKDSPERCCSEEFGKVVTFDPTKGDKCCRGKTHSKTLIAAEAGKDAVCCGDDFIKSSEKSQQCCGKKIFGIKYDKRFQACCASQTESSLYSALAESCCGGKVISKSSTKCVQDEQGLESPAPMDILDYLSKGKLPPWLACTESRMGDRVMMPASCRKPPFRWEEVYEDD
ncbi:Oidioi.mRNA.OKI2018_I69.chr2.g7673.t1.cds [Oikopleura dioica]|uniref:Oidioi.mRNA.OKI2018_I69.chr2.g7673.t1.cds n=1 Tax=Oikopleura dioica TaxID=34765 RepID=A0ABN7T7F6_OIKDI|nr:Oidioi.mRNA.OKI2018_I69.chr2.g7673.t1.cds [Oikopleura dioica]